MSAKLISLRIPEELYQYLMNRAKVEHRTFSNMVLYLLLEARTQDTDPSLSEVYHEGYMKGYDAKTFEYEEDM